MLPITEIAEKAGIPAEFLHPQGRHKAKVDLNLIQALPERPGARTVVVTAVTPTPLGEGKTVTSIGLAMALCRLGRRALCTLRQPSLGPLFGVKGGATGGGRSHLMPAEEINLHFTGDIHAVATAHNLLAAMVDNHLKHTNSLRLNSTEVYWNRTVDMNDRALRDIVIGLGGDANGVARETAFEITAASEVMAILALCEGYADLKERLGRILVAADLDGRGVRASALRAAGAMAALLRDALRPNLVQTSEGTPCLVHAGPFANVAHGNSSVLADRVALRLADYVVTESGFGSECGAEKYFDIKARLSGLSAQAVVLVTTVRAMKFHGGARRVRDPKVLAREDVPAVERGCENLLAHLANVAHFGVPAVVAINRFPTDTRSELEVVRARGLAGGALRVVESEVFGRGSEGGLDLARAVETACAIPSEPRALYDLDLSLEEKARRIARSMYGAADVHFSPKAKRRIEFLGKVGLSGLPLCVAKTPLSLSHDPELRGRPGGYLFPIADVRAYAGAGFVTMLAGEIMTMPGLPKVPMAEAVDLTADGEIVGLM
jgi:formate--tetrahydrofolate ligase